MPPDPTDQVSWTEERSVTPVPDGNAVQCWRITAADCSDRDLQRLRLFLSPPEIQRADRLVRSADRLMFIAAHGVLRFLAGQSLRMQPQAVRFTSAAPAKPMCLEPGLSFNLSHSAGVALIALTRSLPVGVDIEQVRPFALAETIAGRHFHPEEIADLAATPRADTGTAFFRCWTRKEAMIKATGDGLALPLNSFRVTCLRDQPARLVVPPPSRGAGWSLIDLDPGPGYCAALAAPVTGMTVQKLIFTPRLLGG